MWYCFYFPHFPSCNGPTARPLTSLQVRFQLNFQALALLPSRFHSLSSLLQPLSYWQRWAGWPWLEVQKQSDFKYPVAKPTRAIWSRTSFLDPSSSVCELNIDTKLSTLPGFACHFSYLSPCAHMIMIARLHSIAQRATSVKVQRDLGHP